MSLEIKNLTVKYRYGATAVADFSLSFAHPNERVAILAQKEGGKTALLKCLAGLVPPASGQVVLGGKDITLAKPKERNVCLIYDDGGVLPWRRVSAQLEYPLKIRKMPKAERKGTVYAAAEQFSLTHLLTDVGRQLYPDDKLRFAYARSSFRKAAFYCIDNIFASIHDPRERQNLFLEMMPAMRAYPAPVLFATDSPDEAFSFADRVVVLAYGITEQIGTPAEICAAPASLAVEYIVRPDSTVAEGSVAQGVCTANGHRFPAPVENGTVFVSYYVEENAAGILRKVKYHYYKDGKPYALLENGEALAVLGEKKEAYCVAPVTQKTIFFSADGEKRLDF